MSLLTVGKNKDRAIDLLETVLKEFAFHGISFENQKLTMEHIRAMRAIPDDMDLTCQLATEPATRTTEVKITCTFKQGLKLS